MWDTEYFQCIREDWWNVTEQVGACISLHREQDLHFREVSRIQVVFGGEFCRFMLYSGCFLRKSEHKTNKKKRRQDLR